MALALGSDLINRAIGGTVAALGGVDELDLVGDDPVAAPRAAVLGLPLVELQAPLHRRAAALGQVLAADLGQRPEAHDVDVDGAAVLAVAALAPRDRQAQVGDLQLAGGALLGVLGQPAGQG